MTKTIGMHRPLYFGASTSTLNISWVFWPNFLMIFLHGLFDSFFLLSHNPIEAMHSEGAANMMLRRWIGLSVRVSTAIL